MADFLLRKTCGLSVLVIAVLLFTRPALAGQPKMLVPDPGRTSEWHEVTPDSPAAEQAPPIPVDHHSPWDTLGSETSSASKPSASPPHSETVPGASRGNRERPESGATANAPPPAHVYEAIGPETAPVTIVEYVDYLDPFLHTVRDKLALVKAEYPDEVRIVIIDFPWRRTPIEMNAAIAARCAGEQNQFWRYHVALCDSPAAFTDDRLDSIARDLDLNLPAFDECLRTGRHRGEVMADLAEGEFSGVKKTPTVLVNGKPVNWYNLNAIECAVAQAVALSRAEQ